MVTAYVPIDVHRRRSVVMGINAAGERLGVVRIDNDPGLLVAAARSFGQDIEAAIEATNGWYWAVDALQDAGVAVRLVDPARVGTFHGRRVKSDVTDCQALGDLARLGLLPEAWIAPREVRESRELVRYRHKLVQWRSALKLQVHAVLAKLGVQVPVTDLFGKGGSELLDHLCDEDPRFGSAYGTRIQSLRGLIDVVGLQISELDQAIRQRLRDDRGYLAIQAIPGVGPTLAAVFVAEIGDATRFKNADSLAAWAGLTPRHRESDTKVWRGRITKQGSRLVRWAAVEAAQRTPADHWLGIWKAQILERRHKTAIAKTAVARKIVRLVYYGLRDGEIRCLTKQTS